MPVDMAKVERQAPELVSVVKSAGVIMEKRGLADHTARVVLVMDVSGSMSNLYRSGAVQMMANRALVIGLRFDDNGAVEVVTFDEVAAVRGEMDLDNFRAILANPPLGFGTSYSRAMIRVRNLVRGTQGPTYVMFVTDGEPQDPDQTEDELRKASREPIFWQFMAVGDEKFKFLKNLDNLGGRMVDNANFFSVKSPATMSDDEFFNKMMAEYPQWLKDAKYKGIL